MTNRLKSRLRDSIVSIVLGIRKIKDNEIIIPGHFIHKIKTTGNDVIGVKVFPFKLMRFPLKNGLLGPYTTTEI